MVIHAMWGRQRRGWAGVQVRSHVEKQIGLIARGEAEKDAVVRHTLAQFTSKFVFFVAKIARMDSLFDANFSTLSESGEVPSLI